MSLTIHLSRHTTHITLLESPDTTIKQLLAEVADVLTDTGAVTDADELMRLQVGILHGGNWRDLTQEGGTLEQLGINENSVLGYTTGDSFSYMPVADIDLE